MQPPLPAHGGARHWAARIAGCLPEEILDFSASINPLGPPDSVRAAFADSFSSLLHYPDPECSALRHHLARKYSLDFESILCGNGAAELITWVARECAGTGNTILPVPAFADYRRALGSFKAPYLTVPLEADFGLPVLPEGEALILANPHNPSGRLYRRDELCYLLDRFQLVVIDEAFIDFVDDHERHSCVSAVEASDHLIVLRSLTKFYSLPGLRLGYAVLPPAMARRWQSWRDPWSVNALAQQLGLVALEDGDFEQRTRQWLPEARTWLTTRLDSLPGLRVLPSAANFLLVHTETSALTLQTRLLSDHRILIRHCTTFEGMGEDYFRVAVRSEAENQQLVFALQALLSVTCLPASP